MLSENPQVRHPFGEAAIAVLPASGSASVTIQNDLTIIDGETTQATAARTVNLEIAPDLKAGARIVVKHKASATAALTPGTGMTGAELTGTATKLYVAEYIYDGTKFVQLAPALEL